MPDLDADGIGQTGHSAQRDIVDAILDLGDVVLPDTGPRLHIFLRQMGFLARPPKIGSST